GLQERQLFSLQIRESSSAIASFLLSRTCRHLYFLQIRSDIREGRLCPLSAAVVLASYAVQSEMGDHCPARLPSYLSKCYFIPEQDEDFLSRVEDLHPQHKGLKQSEAELCFLNTARTLELYGVELHAAMDTNDAPLKVGLASSGVAIFCNMICSSFFPWGNIIKISFKRKRFLIHLKRKHVSHSIIDLFFIAWNTLLIFIALHTWLTTPLNVWSQHHFLLALCQRVVGGMVWNPVLMRSISSEYLETKSLPSRSPPNTPNWRSPRVRHGIRKPRPSSVELTNDMNDMSEGEDVFYTYRASVSSSKDSEGDTSPHQLKKLYFLSFSYSQVTDEALLRIDDSIGEEDGDHSSHHYDKGVLGDGDLMLICITPDHDGKFGFNVKGGVDQKMPLAISHVKPDSPAGRCEPKLLEGDLLVLINGRDISEHTHDQVVMFIRASRESHSRELALLIRRKGVCVCLHPALTLTSQSQGDKLSTGQSERVTTVEESMRQLERGIQSGTLCFHFENLYRRKPGLSLNCARLPENMEKNRYKDVLPYDATRVVLQGSEDYINGMSGVCLRYVAAQGPLPQTCTHFWQTVWEQQIHTIIMLTTLTERGRTKCHQYWPHPPEVKDYGHMRVKCHSEECNLAYVTRQFTLTHTQRGEERAVTHLQYVAWPDHGVPDDPSDFLLFISSVRERRRGEEPLMVHCSAGIGRTGVLITMETALTLLDEDKPVFPLDIVKTLRDQRAMMIQTTVRRNKDGIILQCVSLSSLHSAIRLLVPAENVKH
uniref:protein-tyrosine-phosphatase n=1 Tax=Cyclopterus lumpus TaxID=8103 RepID=A0A8C2X0S8_CYCLU